MNCLLKSKESFIIKNLLITSIDLNYPEFLLCFVSFRFDIDHKIMPFFVILVCKKEGGNFYVRRSLKL